MAGNHGNNRIIWEPWQLDFLFANWQQYTAKQLSVYLGITRTKVREKLYENGLYKLNLEFWSEEQTNFLIDNYKLYGDSELAEIFETKWNKDKGWTKKHIEKKRRYLNLKRSDEEILQIHKRNVAMKRFAICPVNAWNTRGRSGFGERRMWKGTDGRLFMAIKLKHGFVHYAQWLYKQVYGPVPPGKIVRLKDGDPFNVTLDNLMLVTRSEHAILNSKNRLPAEIRELVQLNQKLQKTIYDQSRKTRSGAS